MSKHPRLGQHFLTRPEIAGWVADAAEITSNNTVLEIGPGHGILTRELLKRAGKVIAVEKDENFVKELNDLFQNEIALEKLVLMCTDIRSFEPSSHGLGPQSYQLVANIPYYITGEIIRKFLTYSTQPQSMTLLVQKEVAERVVAKDGKESLLSLSVKAYGTPHYIRTVKAGSFSPPPKVDSAILHISNINRQHFASDTHERLFFEILRIAFGTKRKLVRTTLRGTVSEAVFDTCGVEKSARPEELTLSQWLTIAESF